MPKNTWFSRHPKLTLLLVNAVGVAVIVGVSIVVIQSIRSNLKHGVERYVLLRENRPFLETMKTPGPPDMQRSDSLVQKPYHFQIDENGFIMPSTVHDQADWSVVFLGGSTTECGHNDEDKRFPYLAGRLAENMTGLKVNSYNHGYSGSNTFHSLVVLLTKIIPMQPDACVLMHNFNDLLILLHEPDYWNTSGYKRPIQVEHDPRNVLTFWDWVKDVLRQGRDYLYSLLGMEHAVDEFASSRDRPVNTDKDRFTRLFAANLKMFVDICRDTGITPVLMTQFNRYRQPLDPQIRANLNELEDRLDMDGEVFMDLYHALNQTIRRIARERGVLLIDLDRKVPKTSDYLFDEIHLNTHGSVEVARIVAKALAPLAAAQTNEQ